MKNIIRWLSPLILSVVITLMLRAATDITLDNTIFVYPERNLWEFLFLTPIIYLMDWRMRTFLKRMRNDHRKEKNTLKEYLLWSVEFALSIIVIVFLVHRILDIKDLFRDYMLAEITVVPILLIYYTLLRNGVMQKYYAEQTLQLEKIKSEQLGMELEMLKAQYHPHFLFNALNTVYFQIDEKNQSAKETVELLSDLLRYQIYDVQQPVTLSKEVDFLKKYIKFRQMRTSDRLVLECNFDLREGKQKIHPLLFQPLLENAFKYAGGDYRIKIDVRSEPGKVTFSAENSLPAEKPNTDGQNRNKGIGIENLKRRLTILYPGKHRLRIEPKENSFYAELTVQTD